MIPSDYRLHHVASSILSRLEGSRRSYRSTEEAEEAFRRIVDEQITSVSGEMRELGVMDQVEDQVGFLEQEIHQTLLPRYVRLALAMNEQEEANFGFGPLGTPVGRAGLGMVGLGGLVLFLRLVWLSWTWPLFLLCLSVPFWPDMARVMVRRRYSRELRELVDDLEVIQQEASRYVPPVQAQAPGRAPPVRESQ